MTAVHDLFLKWLRRDLTTEDFEQVKAMEKEQIMQAHLSGFLRPLELEATKQAEQYYNETYGSNT